MKIWTGVLALLALVAGSLLVTPRADATAMQQSQTTAHYKIVLSIGAAATMLTPAQAAGATAGEAMVAMPGMAMPAMAMTDQGQPVNHHLEVAVLDKTSGQVLTDPMPTITITNDATGGTRPLQAALMYDVQVGRSDLHFGNNVYLADGTYTITAVVNGETASFARVPVSSDSSMSGGSMNGGSMAGATMPSTGTGFTPLYGALLALGALILVAGLLLGRRTRVR